MKSVSSKTYQTLCEDRSGVSTVQGTPDCVNIGRKPAGRQLNNSDSRFYCAKVDRVKVPVSGGKYQAVVDAVDHPIVATCKWFVFLSGKNVYAQDGDGRLMHRVIAGANVGSPLKVDHRDGDGLNNTRENLRIGTQSQNLANQRQRTGTKSGLKGVSPSGDCWKAEIGFNRKRIYIGRFKTAEEAAAAYNAKAIELFGSFARLNPSLPPLFLPSTMGSSPHKR